MKKLLLALLFGLCAIGAASAQRVQQPTTSGVVCIYNSSPITLQSGWFGYAQCDSSGKLIVSGGGGGGTSDASAANQTSQITQETAINTALGLQANSTWDGSSAATLMSIARYQGVKLEAVRALLAVLPTSVGQKTAAGSLSVVLSSDGPFATNFGLQADSAAAGDTSTASLISLIKRLNQNITTLDTDVKAVIPDCGATPCTNKIGVVGLNTWAAGVLGAMANYGTSPGAVLAPGVNAFVTNKVLVTPDSVALPANQSVNVSQVNGVTTQTGSGAVGTGTQRVNQAIDQATNAGAALVKGGVGVVNGGSTYQAVAASATATVLQTSTGAIGDYLSHCTIYPATTSPGVVTVFDNANAAATNVIAFPGGASSVSNLVPFAIPVGAVSTAGAWKVTTGANVSVVCEGKFS